MPVDFVVSDVLQYPCEPSLRVNLVQLGGFNEGEGDGHEQLEMTRGLSTDDEPDIWQKNLSGELEMWVALGLPDAKIIRQSCGKANKVIVYSYGGRTAEMWWEKIKNNTTRFDNLEITNFSEKNTSELRKQASRSMKLQVNIQNGEVMVSDEASIVYVPAPYVRTFV